jgi:hypothetical protein
MRLVEIPLYPSWETLSISLLSLPPFQPTGIHSLPKEILYRVSSPPCKSSHLMGCCVAAFVERRLIPVGPAYLAHVRRAVHDLSFEEHDKHLEEEQQRRRNLEQEADEEDDLGVGDEKETEDLLSLDPKEWKVSRSIYLSIAVVLCTMFLETRSLCCPGSVTSKT